MNILKNWMFDFKQSDKGYRKIRNYMLFIVCMFTFSCNYLDIVPDNTLTVDHAFKSRYEAEGYLYGIYGAFPDFAYPAQNPAFWGGDEVWYVERGEVDGRLWNIARGFQGTASPLADYWASIADAKRYANTQASITSYAASNALNGGRPLFTALNDCNVFLDNVGKVIDLSDTERTRWIAEVKFLKAFFHFYLLRMYGPIPIIYDNAPMDAPGTFFREPVDDVVEYIVTLIDEAVPDLPPRIEDMMNELGRATQPMALAMKAQALTLAASPLFNGNPDYASFTDKRGIPLFSQTYSADKWKRAADALKEAIEVAHGPDRMNHWLYDFKSDYAYGNSLDEKTVMAMQVRGAATERWNNEIIWGACNSSSYYHQQMCQPIFVQIHVTVTSLQKNYAPPLHIVEQFYTKNGVPIEEDKEWVGIDRYALRTGDEEHSLYISRNEQTMNLHFDREARFYGAITFDRSTFFGNGRITSDNDLLVTQMRLGEPGGGTTGERYLSTGYQCKKLLNLRTSISDGGAFSTYEYVLPVIRLADLYLMYAEALNEWKAAPDAEVYEYIDLVRNRTGLEGVVASWRKYALDPEKPSTKEGMRDIIRRERMNELAFEGIRFWDLRRWKLAKEYMNKPIRGLNISGATAEEFNQVQTVYPLHFEDKDYLWPIRQAVLMRNTNLVQNPGW